MNRPRFILGLVCLAFLSARADDTPGNLVRNPGFELGDAPPPPNWQCTGTGRNWPAFGTYDAEVKHGGARSFRMVRQLDKQHTYWYQENVPVEPESDYVFGGWIKTADVQGDMGAFLHIYGFPKGTNNHADRLFSVQLAVAKGTQDWTEYKGVFRTPPPTHHLTFFLQHSKCSGTAWFDDIYVRPASPAEVQIAPPWAREVGVVAWQTLNEIVKGKFADASPRHVKGTLAGKDARPTAEGRLGGAIEFTGPDGCASIDTNYIGDYVTVELWVYRRKQADPQPDGEVLVAGEKWSIRIDQTVSKDRVVLIREKDRKQVLVSKTPIPFDEWTHVAVTAAKPKPLRLYINGRLDAERGDEECESFSGRVTLCDNAAGRRFIGKMDEVAIFSRVKTAEEICQDMSRSEPVLSADNGLIEIHFEQPSHPFLNLFRRGQWVGSLDGAVAQFEKRGIGYKKAGIGSAYPSRVKSLRVEKKEASECAVEVTLERTVSLETQRMFEATYRIELAPGRAWFTSRLVSVKNTDAIPYELRGYYHLLQPKTSAAVPRSYGQIGGWIGSAPSVGAVQRTLDDFTLGFRKVGVEACGEIARSLKAPLQPGMTWTGDEPPLLIFVAPTADEKEFLKAARETQAADEKGARGAKGAITYKEKATAVPPK